MLARIRLFHNFLHHSKGTEWNKENEISSNNQPFSRNQLLFIDESAKRWEDFSGKYQYNQLCKRENISVVDDDRYLKTQKQDFCRRAIYVWLTAAETQFSSWWKPPMSRKIENAGKGGVLKCCINIKTEQWRGNQ